jgi:hypothetical protein
MMNLSRKTSPLALGLLGLLIVSCAQKGSQERAVEVIRDKNWNRSRAEIEYELLQAELRLARIGKPYLVLDVNRGMLFIKLKGAVVWDSPMELADADSSDVGKFVERFSDNNRRYVRPISEKYLFAASEKTPDTILAIVGEAVNVDPELLQRVIPQRFQLRWNHGLILDIHTDIPGKPTSKFKNTFVEFRRALQRPFGEAYIGLKMSADDALTLYRASQPGLPTLICPAR